MGLCGRTENGLSLLILVVRGRGRRKGGAEDKRVGEEGPGEGKVGGEGGVGKGEEEDGESRGGRTKVWVELVQLEEGEVGKDVVRVVCELLLRGVQRHCGLACCPGTLSLPAS